MNKQTQEALKMAIEAMTNADKSINEFFEGLVKLGVPERLLKIDKSTKLVPAINACKEALEKPAQEPLTRAQQVIRANNKALKQPAWQGLTDDEIEKLNLDGFADESELEFARAIEQALKEKNAIS